jgi:hypothetical protein
VGEAGEGQTLYLVMNWVEGEPLDEWVRRRPDRDPFDALKLLLGVASALDLMHSGRATGGIPVVHRDVKPSNIVVTDDGTVLVDFGLTRGLPDGQRLSAVMGTPGYLAPEATEAGIYTPATDRYALGAVAYFVLTGSEPPASHQPKALRTSLMAVPALANRPEAVDHLMAMLDAEPTCRPTVLTNWVGQLRRSSLAASPDVLAPEAPKRNPQPAWAHRRAASQLPTGPVTTTTPGRGAIPAGDASPLDYEGRQRGSRDHRWMVPALAAVSLLLLALSVGALTVQDEDQSDKPAVATASSLPAITSALPLGPSAAGPYRDLVLATPGLISYWRLGEPSGTQAYDQKRQGANGDYLGGNVGLGKPGIPGANEDMAVSLNGASGYLRIPSDPLYNLDAFTVELWIYLDSYGNTSCYRELIRKGQGPEERSFGLYLSSNNSTGAVTSSFGPRVPGRESFVTSHSSRGLDLGSWNHLALVHPAGGNLTLYINGSPETPSIEAGSPVTSTAPIVVGDLAPIRVEGKNAIMCPPDAATRRIDELALYQVALASDQIREHFRAGMAKG